jgi:hypothetical protein
MGTLLSIEEAGTYKKLRKIGTFAAKRKSTST